MQLLKFHPGETVVLNFTVPFSTYDIKAVSLSFRGPNSLAFEETAIGFKDESYTDDGGKTVYRTRIGYTMNQAESLQFEEKSDYMMQLNIYGPNGSRITSKEMKVKTLEQQIMEPSYTVMYNDYGSGRNEKPDKGVYDYNELVNKPQVNEVDLVGNRTLPEKPIAKREIDRILLD